MAKTRRYATALAAAAAAAAAALHLAAALRAPLGAASDDALHLLLARNLLSGGYAVPDAAGVPVGDPLPGFPLLMALPVGLLSPHWGLLRGAALLAAAVLVFLAWRLGRRLAGAPGAWAAALLAAANPALAAWAGVALPDIPFVAASVGGLLLLARDSPRLPELTALAALAALLRPQGALLAVALAAGVGFRSGHKRAGLFLAGALAPLGLWLLRGAFLNAAAMGTGDNWRLLRSFIDTSLLFRGATLLAGLGRGFFGGLPPPLALAALAAAGAAAVFGALRLWRANAPGARAVVLACAVDAAGLALLHVAWRAWDGRYALAFLAPALPLWAAAFAGLREKRRGAALAALLLFAAPGLRRAVSFAVEGASAPRAPEGALAAAWIRANVPNEDAMVSTEPSLFALTGARRVTYPPSASTREAWIAALRDQRVRWVVVSGSGVGSSGAAPRDPLTQFDDWAVPSPPLTLSFSDDPEGILILHLE
jgi:hypothetical protein